MTRQPKRRAKAPAGRIPYVHDWQDADGVTHYRWIPSPRLRRGDWKSQDLGTDHAAALALGIARNRDVAAWEQGRSTDALAAGTAAATARRVPRRMTFGDLVHDYRADIAARAALPRGHDDHLAPKTIRQYQSQLRLLLAWAQDGDTALAAITPDVCTDLRNTLVNGASAFAAAARLRMLRQLLGFAAAPRRKYIAANPMDGVRIPTPAPRQKRAAIEAIESLAAFARTWSGTDKIGTARAGGPNLELAVLLGFFTTQREGDLLAATRMCWRAVDDVDAFDRATLSTAANGALFALRVRQQKTDKWVTVFVPADVGAKLDALIDARGAGWDGPLLQDDAAPRESLWPESPFQRTYAAMRDAAIEQARNAGDKWLADQLTNLQYRDMRRSGMCWLRDMGVPPTQIATVSGHSIQYTLKILDTYMPGDARGSAAAIASALRTRATRTNREKKG